MTTHEYFNKAWTKPRYNPFKHSLSCKIHKFISSLNKNTRRNQLNVIPEINFSYVKDESNIKNQSMNENTTKSMIKL